MDKETLSNYGWVVIVIIILVILIALATPFGNYISEAVMNSAESLRGKQNSVFEKLDINNNENINTPEKLPDKNGFYDITDKFYTDVNGNMQIKPMYAEFAYSNGTVKEVPSIAALSKNAKTLGKNSISESMIEAFLTDNAIEITNQNKSPEFLNNYVLNLIKEYYVNPDLSPEQNKQEMINTIYDEFASAFVGQIPGVVERGTNNATMEDLDNMANLWKSELLTYDINFYKQEFLNEVLNSLQLKEIPNANEMTIEEIRTLAEEFNMNDENIKYHISVIEAAGKENITIDDLNKILNTSYVLLCGSTDNFLKIIAGESNKTCYENYIPVAIGIANFGSLNDIDRLEAKIKNYNKIKITENVFGGTPTQINQMFLGNYLNPYEIQLPSTVYLCNEAAFNKCENLEKVNMENFTTVKQQAFSECTNLKEIQFSSKLNDLEAGFLVGFVNQAEKNITITCPENSYAHQKLAEYKASVPYEYNIKTI